MDPQSKFQPATNTLSEIFLVNFISFCVEKGVEERIATSKMTEQQSSLFGVDWVWSLSGADKQIKLQVAVQALQLAELSCSGGGPLRRWRTAAGKPCWQTSASKTGAGLRSWRSSAAWWDGTAWACSSCSVCQGSPRPSEESC